MTFDQCGGDSLAAMSYAAHLEKAFGTRIGVSTILGCPCVADMAKYLESANNASPTSATTPLISLIGRPPGEATTAIVFFHPAGGGGYLYDHFVDDRMLKEHTIAIVDSPFLTGEIPGDGHQLDVQTIARQYLHALTDVLRPDMNLVLAGYSFGAFLAWESGIALQQAGHEITSVLNIDQPVISAMRRANLLKRIGNWGHRFKTPLQTWEDMKNLRQQNQIRQQSNDGELDESPLHQSKSLRLEDFYVQIENAYAPQPAQLPLHVIRGDIFEAKYSLPRDYGWGTVTSDVKVSRIAGTHSTLFNGPQLEALTRAVRQAIDSEESHVQG